MRDIYHKLIEEGYIDYGKRIPIKKIEALIGCNAEKGWEFLGPYLELRAILEDNGYFVTSRGCLDGSLRILNIDEMSEKCEKTIENIMRKQRKTVHTMSKADISLLNERDKKKHELALNKSILGMHAMKSVIYSV